MDSSLKTSKARYDFFDGLRGIAILWIVCFHVTSHHHYLYGKFAGHILASGYLGIDIFLIISGFGISNSIKHLIATNGSPINFIKRRLSFIYIPYFYSLLFFVIVIPKMTVLIFNIFGAHLVYPFPKFSIIQWISYFTLTRVFTASSWSLYAQFDPYNGPVWFLAIIVQIYLVIFIATLFKKHYFKIIYFVTLLSLSAYFPQTFKLIPYGLFLPYWPPFAFGIILFYLLKNEKELKDFNYHICGIFITLIILLTIVTLKFKLTILSKTLFDTCCIFFIWIINPYNKKITQTVFFKFFIFLGLFSYSIYLIHHPLYTNFGRIISALCPTMPPQLQHLSNIPLVIGISYIWHLFFEKPFRSPKTKKSLLKKFLLKQ